jgi:hypothetical protein
MVALDLFASAFTVRVPPQLATTALASQLFPVVEAFPDFEKAPQVKVQFQTWAPVASVSNWMLGHSGVVLIVNVSFWFGFVNLMRIILCVLPNPGC